MKYLIIFLLVQCIGSYSVFCQHDFRSGYIINYQNDTIYGFIDYKGDKANSKVCVFKSEISSEDVRYSPNEIKAYSFIDGKYYVSKSVGTDDPQLFFLEYLFKGIVSIYYYRSSYGHEFYFLESSDGKLTELKNEEREVLINNVSYLQESKEYIGLLKYTFRDSPSITQKVNNTSLSHKSLINIANEYHNEVCPGEECIIYEKHIKKPAYKLGVNIGINRFTIVENAEIAEDFYYLRNSHFGSEIVPSFGVFLKINYPRLNERVFFQFEFVYSKLNLETTNSYIEPTYGIDYINEISFRQHILNNLFTARYEFPKGRIRPTFQIGPFLNYSHFNSFQRSYVALYPWGGTYTSGESTDNPLNSFDYGINVGLGFKWVIFKSKEIYLDLKYQRGFGLLYGFNTNIIMGTLGIQLFEF